jgi:asparagine synthase (glutamine-hydrolysing)
MARDDGVTKLLAGDGGDELFGGNARYAKQRVFGWYQGVPAPLRGALMEPLLERTPLGNLPLLKKGKSYVEQAKVPMPERDELYNLILRLGLADVLTPEFLGRVDDRAPARLRRQVWEWARTGSEVNRTLAFDWRFTLADSDLPKVRGTTALAGVSVRFPFLADDVLAFSLKLPADYKLKGLKLRWFFKEALRGFLPDEIITKKKQGFGLPFGVWATRHAGLRELALDSLSSFAKRGIVRPDFIRTLVDQRLPEHPGYYGEMVWILMMLEQWLRRVRPDGRAPF